jgi:hypothetical protein
MFLNLGIGLLNKFLVQVVELKVVISDHVATLSVKNVSFFGGLACWKIIDWVEVLVVNSTLELGFAEILIDQSDLGRGNLRDGAAFEIILSFCHHWIRLECFRLQRIVSVIFLFDLASHFGLIFFLKTRIWMQKYVDVDF